jgi:hypothetical protein
MLQEQSSADSRPKSAILGLQGSASSFSQIVQNEHDIVGLIALANIVIVTHKSGQQLNPADLLSSLSQEAIEIYRNSAAPILEAHNQRIVKHMRVDQKLAIADGPLYLKLTENQNDSVSLISSQLNGLENLVRDRTNIAVQIGVGVASAVILGLFVLLGAYIAPTTVFHAISDLSKSTPLPASP